VENQREEEYQQIGGKEMEFIREMQVGFIRHFPSWHGP